MIHLGDITKIHGALIPPTHCITFGAPCQDVSVAGGRAGMKHAETGDDETTRSGLFFEAIRIIREMRAATHGEYPTFAVWENVPGAYSSNKGEDFRAVLEAFARLKDETATIPQPPKGKWLLGGAIVGDDYSIAWRTHDAQYWGVPQRRRRIAVVMDFRGHRASQVLFESESLRGDSPPSRLSWERASSRFAPSTRVPSSEPRSCDADGHGTVGAFEPGAMARVGGHFWFDVSGTIRADMGDNQYCVLAPFKAYSIDSLASNSMKSANPHSCSHETDTYKTLDTSDQRPDKNQGGSCICHPFTVDQMHQNFTPQDTVSGSLVATHYKDAPIVCTPQTLKIRSGCEGGGKGALIQENLSATLGCNNDQILFQPVSMAARQISMSVVENATPSILGTDYKEPNIVFEPQVYECHSQDSRCTGPLAVGESVTAKYGTGGGNVPLVTEPHSYENHQFGGWQEGCGTRKACGGAYGGGSENLIVEPLYIVRRLVPVEAERLQGYPDQWTDIGDWVDEKGKTRKGEQSNSHRYKSLGNSIALPFWYWMFQNMKRFLPDTPSLGSLFDGIGGFPLTWLTATGGRTLWASEIEGFPVAVTNRRFNFK